MQENHRLLTVHVDEGAIDNQAAASKRRILTTVGVISAVLVVVAIVALWQHSRAVGSASVDGFGSILGRGPFAVASGGSGFAAMTVAMAYAHALEKHHMWAHVSHLSTVSGSSWFSAQFLYSQEFRTRLAQSLPDTLDWWGSQHDGIRSDVCGLLKRCRKWTGEYLNISMPQLASVKLASAERTGPEQMTLMQCATLPPDSWLHGYQSEYKVDLQIGGSLGHHGTVPVCFAIDENSTMSWMYNENLRDSLTVQNPISGAMGQVYLPTDSAVDLATITSGSSCASGSVSSPSMTENLLGGETQSTPVPGYEETAVPLDGSDSAGWGTYRMMDGAYTESTGAAFAIGGMQRDCRLGKLNCTSGLRIIVLNHDLYPSDMDPWLKVIHAVSLEFLRSLMPKRDRNERSMKLLFKDDVATQPGELSYRASLVPEQRTLTPLPTIFDKLYDDVTWTDIPGFEGEGLKPRYTIIKLITVANKWFGVEAGWKVKALLVNGNHRTPIMTYPRNIDNAACVSYFHDGFSGTYKDYAVKHAEFASSILGDFAKF